MLRYAALPLYFAMMHVIAITLLILLIHSVISLFTIAAHYCHTLPYAALDIDIAAAAIACFSPPILRFRLFATMFSFDAAITISLC